MSTWRKVCCCLAMVAGLGFGVQADFVPNGDYIKDGLVAHWDAIDNAATGTHDPAAAKWVDKVGGVELTGAFTVGETTMAPSADISGTVTGLWELDGYTVETLSYRTDGKGLANSGFIATPRISMGYTSNGSDTFCVSLASSSNVSWMRYYFESDKPKQHALATRTASYLVGAAKASGQPVFYYDGVETASSRLEGWTGTWAQNDDVKVREGTTYHSIRIYKRILSAEEVEYNYAVDQKRFFGNLEPISKYARMSAQPVPDQPFCGTAIEPELQVTIQEPDGPVPLTKDVHYAVTFANNLAVGTATATIRGLGAYEDELPIEVSFDIVVPSEEDRLLLAGDFSRKVIPAGAAAKVTDLRVTDGAGQDLDPSAYTVSYVNNTSAGVATVWAKGTSGALKDVIAVATFQVAVLPAGYEQLEWIESTGTQYIKTGLKGASYGLEMRFGNIKTGNDTTYFGTGTWGGSAYLFIHQNDVFKWYGGGGSFGFGYIPGDDYVVTVEQNGNVTVANENGTQANTLTSQTLAGSGEITFFGCGNSRFGKFRFYSARLWNAGGDIRDYVPVVRVSDGVAGLFDLANPTKPMLENAGSGEFVVGPYASRLAVAPIDSKVFLGEAFEPVPAVTDRDTGAALVEGRDYKVDYADNAAPGMGKVIVTGLGEYAGYRQVGEFLIAGILRVKGDAPETGSGASWSDAMTWANALQCAATSDVPHEIWVAGTTTLAAGVSATLSKWPLTVRGGFAGTEGRAEERPAGLKATVDGAGAYNPLSVNNSVSVELERIRLVNALTRGVTKSGGGDLKFIDCEIVNCGQSKDVVSGRGLSLSGTGATVTLTNCLVAGCVDRANGFVTSRYCGAMDIQAGLRRVVMDGCRFLTNGVPFNATARNPREWRAAAIYAESPVTLRGCEFRGNTGFAGGSGGAIVWLAEGSANSAFTNCLWVGNADLKGNTYDDNRARGCIYVSESAAADRVDVVNCTFAYNIVASAVGTAGVNVGKGTVRVKNCIFFGNAVHTSLAGTVDMRAHSTAATLEISNTLAYDEYPGVQNATGDPCFVTPPADFLSCIDATGVSLPRMNLNIKTAFHFKAAAHAAVMAMDVHCLSKEGYFKNDGLLYEDATTNSPAIDAGDRTMSCALEKMENGGIVNIGVYGNTPEAAKTPIGQPTLADDGIAVAWVDGWSQPRVTVTPGISSGDDYVSTVEIALSKNGTDWIDSFTLGGVHPGSPVVFQPPFYFDPATDRLYVRVRVVSSGATEVARTFEYEVEGAVPPWNGKGGDSAKVIHVRAGATGRKDGTSWTDAFDDWVEAIAAANVRQPAEIWIAGTLQLGAITTTLTPTVANLTIRGGFDGSENAPSDRQPGAVSTLDGIDRFATLPLNNANPVRIERLVLTRGMTRGLTKTGAGDIVCDTCTFSNCCYGATSAGLGSHFTGTKGVTKVTVTNCTFALNRCLKQPGNYMGSGHGATFVTCGEVTIDDSVFYRNGQDFAAGGILEQTACWGAAFYASDSPVVVRNSRFFGNRRSSNGSAGGIIALRDASYPSAFSNCVFAANEDIFSGTYSPGDYEGVVLVELGNASGTVDFSHCSFGYNVADGASASTAGINVRVGAVSVVNSIFFGAVTSGTTRVGRSMHVAAGSSADVRYTMFEGEGDLTADADATLTTDHLFYGDASFVASRTFSGSLLSGKRYTKAALNQLAGLSDLHLLSTAGHRVNADGEWHRDETTTSLAIDKGFGDVGDEPMPNGGKRNLGAFGGTAEASMTSVGQPSLAADDVEVEWVAGWAQPKLAFATGIASGDDYLATVVVRLGGDGETWLQEKTFTAVHAGNVLSFKAPFMLDRTSQRLYVEIDITADGAEDVHLAFDREIGADIPYWYGHGGDAAKVIHVRPGATGENDGTSWMNAFTNFAAAGATVTATRNEIWFASEEGVVTNAYSSVNPAAACTIRGGFTGIEDSADERAAGAVTVIDGQGARNPMSFANAKPVLVERFVFTRGKTHGVEKSGAGNLALVDCRLAHNACGSDVSSNGRGGSFSGSAGLTVVAFTNCVIEGNVETTPVYDGGVGHGVYLENLKLGVFENCLFVTNGYRFAQTARVSNRSTGGAALKAKNAPVSVSNTRFVANTSYTSGQGGIVLLESNCGGSAFDHCLWVGNRDAKGTTWDDNGITGALALYMDSVSREVSVENCTFAYNYVGTAKGAAAISCYGGCANIRNSVFYGNVVPTSNAADNDVQVSSSNGKATIAYSVLDHVPATASCDHLTVGAAAFVTPLEDFLACIAATTPAYPRTAVGVNDVTFTADALEKILAFDVHDLSKAGYYRNDSKDNDDKVYTDAEVTSPAVDAGDPTMDCSRENPPNGGVLNAGFYGNTPEAAMTPVGQPSLTADGIAVEWVDGWSQPKVTVTLGIASGDDYAATVRIYIGRNGTDWIESTAVGGVHPNAPVEWLSTKLFDPQSDRLYVKVEVTADGATALAVDDVRDVEAELPPWAGKGGDPTKVVHYRASATGANDGTNWQDAYADLGDALAALTETRNELWVAGSNVVSKSAAKISPEFETVIRGGFDATEDTLAERVDGAVSVIDGNYLYEPLTVANKAKMTVERMKFRAAASVLFNKTLSAGDVVFDGCVFGEQRRPSVEVNARGVCLVGSSGAKAFFTNCLFTEVQVVIEKGNTPASGIGLYAETMGRVTLDGCDFICCGRAPAGGVQLVQSDCYGAAIGANGVPVTARGCRFVGCSLNDADTKGGIVALNGNCNGSAFTNCAWIANDSFFGQTYTRSSRSGALVVRCDTVARKVDIQNCTFACNVSDGNATPVDLHVVMGDVTVGNSIFCGEYTNIYNTVSKAAYLREGSLKVSYSLFESSADIGAVAGAAVETNDLVFGSAGLVYDTAQFPSVLTTVRGVKRLPSNFKTAVLPLLNIHLRGGSGYVDETTGERVADWAKARWASPALNAGDPKGDCSREPKPNGHRVNIGAYGNTPWATMSPAGGALIVR